MQLDVEKLPFATFYVITGVAILLVLVSIIYYYFLSRFSRKTESGILALTNSVQTLASDLVEVDPVLKETAEKLQERGMAVQDLQDVPKNVDELFADKEKLDQDLKDSQRQLENKIAEYETLQQEKQQLEEHNQKARDEQEEKEKELLERIESLTTEIEQGKEDMKKTEGELDEALRKIEELTGEFHTDPLQEKLVLLYDQSLNYLKENRYENYIAKIEAAATEFDLWKSYILKLAADFEAKIFFPFMDIIETSKYGIVKDKNVLVVPIQNRTNKHDDNTENIGRIFEQLKTMDLSSGGNYHGKLRSLEKTMVRTGDEIDYRLDELGLTEDQYSFLNHHLSAIVIQIKGLRNANMKMINLARKILEGQEHVRTPNGAHSIDHMDVQAIMHLMGREDLSVEEKLEETDKLLGEHTLEDQLKREYQHALAAEKND